jgi:hypothetical protein
MLTRKTSKERKDGIRERKNKEEAGKKRRGRA